MSRSLRLELSGGLYHVTSRGDRREDIYVDDEDREEWLSLLGRVCYRFKWRCHAYCLMDNHYHIVIETAEANMSKGMRQLNGVYTQYYNRRHNRVGHVFQGRFPLCQDSCRAPNLGNINLKQGAARVKHGTLFARTKKIGIKKVITAS